MPDYIYFLPGTNVRNLQISSPLSSLYRIFAAKAPAPSASLYVRTPVGHDLMVEDPDSVTLERLGDYTGQKYNLTGLWAEASGHSNEEAAKEYQLQICLKDADLEVSKDFSQHNANVKEWQVMTSFATKTQQRPDVCIRDLAGIPILISEVHSGHSMSEYVQTANKTLIGLVTHLRYLRIKCDIHHVIGFTFPNMVDRFFVTKVTVTYTDLHFRYAFNVIQMRDVPEEVKQAYEHNREEATHNMHHNQDASNTLGGFPVRLTDAELAEASKQLNLKNSLQQLSSVTSIILKDPDGEKFYKYNSDKAENSNPSHVKAKVLRNLQVGAMLPSIPVELVLPEYVQELFNLDFQVIPMKLPPLSCEQALQCLGCLVESTAVAIERLHEHGYAHLDIRLDNICFHHDGGDVRRAVLIDFDYAIPALSASVHRRVTPDGEVSCMYSRLPQSTVRLAKQYDWMQLGWMAFYVYHYEEFIRDNITYHRMHMVFDRSPGADDTFLRKAILQGEYSPSDLHRSPIYLNHQNPL